MSGRSVNLSTFLCDRTGYQTRNLWLLCQTRYRLRRAARHMTSFICSGYRHRQKPYDHTCNNTLAGTCNVITTSMSTTHFLLNNYQNFKAITWIKFNLKWSYDKQFLTLVVISYEINETRRTLVSVFIWNNHSSKILCMYASNSYRRHPLLVNCPDLIVILLIRKPHACTPAFLWCADCKCAYQLQSDMPLVFGNLLMMLISPWSYIATGEERKRKPRKWPRGDSKPCPF